MIVGSTDRISTRGPPALASNDDSVTATKASKGELRRRIYLINALSRLEQHPFLTGVQVEGERYFRAPRNAVPNSNCSVLESRVGLDSKSHQHQLIHRSRHSNGERCRSDPGNCKVRRPFPNWQSANGALLERLVVCDCMNDLRSGTARFNQNELSCFSSFIGCNCTSNACCIPRQV